MFREISERRKRQKEIEYLSYHDSLTGLYNCRFFDEELKRLNTECNIPLSLLMFDVNGLKLMNDVFGYKAADELLRKVADTMKQEFRADDIIARIGGDEFIIILPKTSSKQVDIIAKRICDNISRKMVNSLAISVSSGWGTKKKLGEDIESILKEAVDNLYRHKLSESTRMRSNTIELVMDTLFEKDCENEEHAKRVSALCESIGVSLRLDQANISELDKLGLMHDIDELTHVINYDLSEIPLKTRILTIVDAYDAMTSERPFRKAMSKDAAIREIRGNAGTQFDLMITKLFIETVIEKHRVNLKRMC